MRQAILDSHNNVLSGINMALAWQNLGEKLYLGKIDDDGNGSKKEIYVSRERPYISFVEGRE